MGYPVWYLCSSMFCKDLESVSFYLWSGLTNWKYVSTFKATLLTNLISISLMNYWDTLMLGIPSFHLVTLYGDNSVGTRHIDCSTFFCHSQTEERSTLVVIWTSNHSLDQISNLIYKLTTDGQIIFLYGHCLPKKYVVVFTI